MERREILGELWKPLRLTFRPAPLKDHISALSVTKLLEPVAEHTKESLIPRISST